MRAPALVDGLLQLCADDATIAGIVGSSIMKDSERTFDVPSLVWALVTEVPDGEIFHWIPVRFSPFTRTEQEILAIRSRLYSLLHKDVEWTLQLNPPWSSGFSNGFGPRSMRVQSFLLDGQDWSDRDGVWEGDMSFGFRVIRQRYIQ